ncbi:putative S1E family peptidase [Rhodococcus sp. AW25M09]|uniref:S1 family peptidase n=1 Tax=Rhodococcus sp. AW25M09 TaxID=1268303 RepID=UPI0002AD0AA8|nr:S1 family peptidase [Rhodococcus sp. AW25M09]CCQ13462.1 putative S1E family peptidase [Rhodococcus sp. AW25M09]
MRRRALGLSIVVVSCLMGMAVSAPRAAAEPLLSPALAEAVARDLGLNPQQFLDRADAARRLAEFTATIGSEGVTGSWLDDDGRPVVAVAGGPTHTEVADAASAAGLLVDASAIDVPPAVHVAVRPLLDLLPFDPSLTAGPIRASSYLGGDSFLAGTPAGLGLRCSLGFNALDTKRGAVNITAGHCDPGTGATGSASSTGAYPMYGSLVGSKFGSFYRTSQSHNDYALIDIDDNNIGSFEGNAVRVPGAGPLHVTGTVDPIVGAPVCKSGSRTGFSCGTILSTGRSVAMGEGVLDRSFSTSICALRGDSGGPVVSGTLAVGISSASTVGDQPSCEFATLFTMMQGQRPELFATPINDVLAENPGLSIRTS